MLMQNNFSKCREWVPRGTSQHKWRWLTTLLLILTLGIGQMWAVDPIENVGTYSTQVISADRTTSTWTFITPGSQVTIPTSPAETEDNDIIFHPGGGSKMKFSSSNGFSWSGNSDGYIYVPAGAAGSISMTVKSASDSRWLQLYVGGEDQGSTKRLWSKEANPATEARGPRTFTFTSSDLTTKGGKTYLHLRDNNSELKIATITVTLTTGTYGSSTPDETAPTLSSSDPANSATGVAVEGTIVLTFSEAIASVDGSKFTLDGATKGTVAIDGTDSKKVNVPYSGAANSATVTLSVAAEAVADAAGNKSAALSAISFTTVAAVTPACPSGISISGTTAYTEGETISLEAALSEGNGEITYNWYKGADLATAKAAGSIGTGASFSKASCVTGDAGNYFCVASKDACSDAESAAYAVTVAAVSYCAELNPATSGDEPVLGTVIAMQTGSYGGSIKVVGRKQSGSFAYTANGLTFNKGGVDSVRVTLGHLIQAGTIISVTVNNQDGSKDQGFYLQNLSKTKKADMHRQTGSTGDTTYVYTAVAGDGLVGVNEFIIARSSSSAALKSLKVSNCGAELLALSSAVSVAGKATVTLSKSLVAAGGTATASYSDLDSEYEFDGWEITSGDATIEDATAATAAITMGTTASVITLKLKEAGVKYAVHFDSKGGSAVDDQLVDKDGYASVPTAPTKFKYTFGGWSETDGGSTPADLASIAITAEKTFYAIWTPKVCPTSGEIYSLVADPTKAPGSNTYYPTTKPGVADLAIYATISGGLAQSIQTTSSNNSVQIQSSTAAMKITADNSIVRALLECPLQEGDTIKLVKDNKLKITFDSVATSAKTIQLASGVGENKDYYVVEAKFAGMDTIHVRKNGSNVSLTSLKVIRPAKYAVTFNMHGHGDQVAQQDILEGGKVTEPATTNITGWDFGGWYKEDTYENEWDFDNDVVSAATEIHAKWTEHVLSNNVALGTLTVNGEDVAIVPSQLVYAVELPFGTTAVPTVAATAADANAKTFEITQASAVDGSATIYVKAEDNTTEATYTINFSVATSKDIQLVFKTGTTPCVGSASTSTQILSNNAAVSTYINQIAFTNVEGAGDNGAEGGSLNVGKKAGNMFTLSAKPGYAFQAMNFLAKIQDATCEYSIDGGAWTELASTNTDGDECYAPFTSGTVHEFRLRSTGTSGVWIRNMQLTIVEACTPITIAWDEEPVEFEVGKAGYAIAATANNGGDITYATADNTIIDVNASTGALTIAGLGSVALSASTPEGDGTTYCANGGNDIEISKAVNTYYLVKFDAQNGDAADEVKYFSGNAAIALPAAPTYAGFDFQGWFDAETGGNQYTEAITPAASMTVYAQWVAQCPGATIDVQPTGASYQTGRTATALVCEATAGNGGALTYEWFTCDDELKTNPVAATAMPSTAVAGTFYYFCKVMEEGCDVEAFSNVVTITVADKDAICLVKAELAPGSSAASITSTSGYYKDDENIAINIKKDLKLGSTGNYVKVAIDGANFQDGDVVEITLASDKTASAWLQIFTDEGTTMVAEMTSGVSREHPNYLTISDVPANTKTLYLYRTEAADGNMNPYPTSMAVYRTCAPILNKVTVAGVDGTPDNTNHIAIEVPFSTTDAALDAIVYDWVSNNDAWTAAHAPAVANTWEWGVENTVTFTDKDGDESVYYITISKAVASTDATLSALTVNGQAIALADGVFDYTFELPYGTTSVPTVVATANHIAATATVDPCTVNGATITVVPEIGESQKQVYTLNFTVSAWKEVVIWDGSTMSAVATSPDAITGFAWAVNGFSSITNYNATCGTKAYTKTLPSGGGASASRNVAFTVPTGYVAKFYIAFGTHSDGNNRGMFIGSSATKTLDETSVLTLYSDSRTNLTDGTSEIVGAGTYYLNPMESEDFYEIRAYLRPGYARTAMLGNGVLGTVCVDHNVAIEDIQGVTVYELMGREPEYGKLAFDEIVSGELEAGAPYVFQAHGDKMIMFYGETSVSEPVEKGNGMYGTFTDQTLYDLNDVYYFAQRALWSCVDLTELNLPANRAYVKLSEIDYLSDPNPAPGRRRITMTVNGEKVATDIENLNASETPVKLIINGQMYILRGEKMFDATGRLVK